MKHLPYTNFLSIHYIACELIFGRFTEMSYYQLLSYTLHKAIYLSSSTLSDTGQLNISFVSVHLHVFDFCSRFPFCNLFTVYPTAYVMSLITTSQCQWYAQLVIITKTRQQQFIIGIPSQYIKITKSALISTFWSQTEMGSANKKSVFINFIYHLLNVHN